jgi:hypothetical protein
MAEIVYVLTNEAMPGLVKIGLSTDSIEIRLTQLRSHTGVPLPFPRLEACCGGPGGWALAFGDRIGSAPSVGVR